MTDARVRRGRKSEHIAADGLRDLYQDIEVVEASQRGRDLRNTPGISSEVKARRGFRPLEWLKQAIRNTDPGEKPIVWCRLPGQGENFEEWLFITTAGHGKQLLKEAGYGTAGGRSTPENPETDRVRVGGRLARSGYLGDSIQETTIISTALLRGLQDGGWEVEIRQRESSRAA